MSVAYSMSTFDVMQADEALQKLFHVGPEELFLVMDDIVLLPGSGDRVPCGILLPQGVSAPQRCCARAW